MINEVIFQHTYSIRFGGSSLKFAKSFRSLLTNQRSLQVHGKFFHQLYKDETFFSPVGPITVRTHSSRRVVNRSSRFHTSAGLDDLDQATTSSGRHSPCNGTGPNPSCSPNGSPHNSTAAPVARESLTFASTSNNGLANPRLPPLPHSYLVHPFAQIRTPDGPRCGGPCCTGSTQHSNKCNGRVGLEYSMGAAMAFAPSRGWLGGSPNTARSG